MIERPNWYGLKLAQEASGIAAFKSVTNSEHLKDVKGATLIISRALGTLGGLFEFILPATMRCMRENPEYDPDKPWTRVLVTLSSFATDFATNALIIVPGLEGPIQIVARRTTLNYATHMGIDFIQHLSQSLEEEQHVQEIIQVLRGPRNINPRRRATPKPKTAESTNEVSSRKRPRAAKPVQEPTNNKPIEIQTPPVPSNIINIKTREMGWLLEDATGQPIKDPNGLLTIEFPGPPKYTARIPESLIGTKYQIINDNPNQPPNNQD